MARHAEIPVWVVAGIGRLLPARMWDALVRRLEDDMPWEADDDIVPVDLVDVIVRPSGPSPVGDALRRIDFPVAPELYKSSNT